MIRNRIWLALSVGVVWVLVLYPSPAISESPAAVVIGKRAEIRLASTTRVGNVVLPPGTYRIQHRIDGEVHHLRLTQRKKLYKPTVVVERYRGDAECKFETLPTKVERTTIETIEGADFLRVTRIEIRGENVAHLF